jgi:hypothetical protein
MFLPITALKRCSVYMGLAWLGMLVFASPLHAQQRLIPLEKLQSGLAFTGPEILDLQADDFANPALPAMDKGAKLWTAFASADKSIKKPANGHWSPTNCWP